MNTSCTRKEITMWTRKLIIVAVVGIVSCMFVSDALGRPDGRRSSGGSGGVSVGRQGVKVSIGSSRGVVSFGQRRGKAFVSIGHRRRHIIGPRRSRRVVVRSPRRRQVFFDSYSSVVAAPSPRVIAPITVTVWISNRNGSKTPVTLRQEGPNYVGPSGEYYLGMPTEEQLIMMYGS